jgi:hypothetical protein
MKKSGKILHRFTSLFRSNSTSMKRKTNRKSQLLQLETLETRQLLTVPVLSSNPNAQMTVYLDFDGEDYGNQIVRVQRNPDLELERMSAIPAFTIDGTPGPDSPAEVRMIEEIFHRVAEDFRPFNVNVTTVQPPAGVLQIKVSVGGNGVVQYRVLTRVFDPTTGALIQIITGPPQTYRFTSPVFAELDAYRGNQINPVLVFPQQLTSAQQNGQTIARLISQGVGRQLGLQNRTAVGTVNNGPIMADLTANPIRDTWTNTFPQNDLNGLTAPSGIQSRLDDFGDSIATAANAQVDLVSASFPNPRQIASGIINHTPAVPGADRDFFRTVLDLTRTTGTAELSINVDGLDLSSRRFRDGTINPLLNRGSNLDVVVNLYSANGTLLASDNPSPEIDGEILFEIPASSIPGNRLLVYYIEVTTTSEFGSLGEYTVNCSLQEVLGAPVILSPRGTVTTVLPTFSWTPSLRADRYLLEVYNATTGALVFSKTTTATQYTVNPEDSRVQPGPISSLPQGNYTFRVRALRGVGGANDQSAWSATGSFTIDVPLPSKPTILSPRNLTGESFPTFSWTKGPIDKGFTLQVFRRGANATRVIHKTNHATNSYVHFAPLTNGTYTVNVRAINAANEVGALSDSVDFTVTTPALVAPRLSAPIGTSTSIQPRFVWNAVTGAAFYRLTVHNLSAGRVQFIQDNLPRSTTFFDPPVMPQGNYRASIQALSNAIGADGKFIAGPASPWHNFTLDLLPPGAPTVTGPRGRNDSPTIETTNPRFTWTVPVRAVKYDLLVNNLTTQTAGVIRQNGLTTTSYISRTNMAQGSYRVWVRAYNLANEVGDWSLPFDFNIDEPTPTVPVITAPVVNSLGYVENANPTFRWTTTTPAAAAYDFTVFNVSLGKTAFSALNLTTPSYVVPTANRLGEFVYRAQVRAKNVSGDPTSWSAPYIFRVNIPDPTTPVLIGPGDTITDTTPTFTWRHSSTSFSYEILIRNLLRNEDISLQARTFSLDPGGQTASYTLPAANALKPGTYRFWVRAVNSLGQFSSWSISKTFVITVQLDEKLQNSPAENPDDLIASRITPALTNRQFLTVKAPENVRSEDAQPEEAISADFIAVMLPPVAEQQTAIPEFPEDEALIDAFMHRLADPSSNADFTFLKS